jgi:structural maintenance of chromosome 2
MKRFDRKSALKLINKYADECNRINEEKKSLELEINDLKANINVNKEIIDKLLNPSLTIDSKSKIILECIEKEKNILIDRKKQLEIENKNLRKKIAYYENIINGEIEINKDNIKDLKDKIFILENENKKKENIIISLNQQLKNLREKELMDKLSNNSGNDYDDDEENEDESEKRNDTIVMQEKIPKEIYVIDPTESVNIMQEDLILYKKAYDNALNKIKEFKTLINKYEIKISELNSHIYKYENSISGQNVIHRNSFKNNYIPINNQKKKSPKRDFEIDEILKITKIPEYEINFLIQNENNIIQKLLFEINITLKGYKLKIDKLTQDNSEMKETIIKITNENLILYKTILELKTKSNFNKYFTQRDRKINIGDSYLNTDVSYIGNVDDIKERKRSLDINNFGMRIKNTEENFNQSADDIRNFVNEDLSLKKNNLTEISSEDAI